MDADFSHNPDDLIRLYSANKNEGGYVAIGSDISKSKYCKLANV